MDLGCGDGIFGKLTYGYIDVGVDLDTHEVQRAKSVQGYEDLIVADARCMPFRSETFNVIIGNSVMEHIPNFKKVLKEAGRVMTSEGRIILTVPTSKFNTNSILSTVFRRVGAINSKRMYEAKRNDYFKHINLFEPYTLKKILEYVGFQLTCRHYAPRRFLYAFDLLHPFNYHLLRRFLHTNLLTTSIKIILSLIGKERLIRIMSVLLTPFIFNSHDAEGSNLFIIAKKSADA
ncbi:MAG: class I SAM-dependent methyltransferase [archaeon]|nr:class I SAM-dependent methyltransferase [archaeon]MCP8314418.1 class I SAM-dependent methyltransferase [archaeon]MCP8319376.1 class I SAM-dependent methyltransferase [archaeon]